MRALITGGAGFIGSHLADALLARGDSVILLDNLSTGRLENIEHLRQRDDVEFVLGSILNADLMDDVISRVDVCFHLAAAVGVQLIVDKPLESLATNIRGSEIVFEKAHKHGTKVLVTSTSEIYGKNTSDRLGEEDDRILGSPLKSRWSYSEAKAIEEILAYTYWRQKGLPTVIVRLFNTVGPRQTGHYGMVIPRFVSQAIKGEPITVYGKGQQTRSFCYVDDLVEGFLRFMALESPCPGPINLGNPGEFTILQLAEQVIALTGSKSRVVFSPLPVDDPMQRRPDITVAQDKLKWQPTVQLQAGLVKTIAYFDKLLTDGVVTQSAPAVQAPSRRGVNGRTGPGRRAALSA